MPKKANPASDNANAAPSSLLERLSAALTEAEMRKALQHVLNGSPETRKLLGDALFKAEARHNAPLIEIAIRDTVPDGVNPYAYLGIDREEFIKAVLEKPNPYPHWMKARSPAHKLEFHIESIDHQVRFFAQLRSEFAALGAEKKIVLHDFVGGKFDHFLSTEAWKGFQALRGGLSSMTHGVNLFVDLSKMTDQDLSAIRNVAGVGFRTMGEIVGFMVLARMTDNFKTLAALSKPLGLDVPANVVPFVRPKGP